MQRKRPLERFFSRLLVFSMLAAQLPLATLARADDSSDALSGTHFGNVVIPVMPPPGKSGLVDPPIPGAPGSPPPPGTPPPAAAPSDPGTFKSGGSWGVAQPIVDQAAAKKAAEDKKAAANKKAAADDKDAVKSPIALCDTSDGTKDSHPGYGDPVAKLPDANSSEFQNKLDAYINERANMSVKGWASKTHLSYPGNQGVNTPDLSAAIQARQRFFDLSFGKTEGRVGAVVAICEAKLELARQLKSFADQPAEKDDTNACSGAFKKDWKLNSESKRHYEKYSDLIGTYLNGGTINPGGKTVKIHGLEDEFASQRIVNNKIISKYKPPTTANRPLTVDEKTWASLSYEHEFLWGKGTEANSKSKKVDTSGMFSNMLLQTRKEKANADEVAASFASLIDKNSEKAKDCGLATPTATAKTPASTPDSTITGTIRPSDLTANTGASHPPPDNADKPDDGAAGQPADADALAKQKADQDARQADLDAREAALNAKTPVVPPADPVTPPPAANDPPNAAGTFLKDNWMWLAGGGVLVGGGLYLYNKNQQDQRAKAYWGDDTNFLPTATATSTSTSSTTTAAAGSKFTFVSSISAPGGIGQSMGPISVTVTDSNNVIQNVSGTVILSCASPSPCSIGGGTTATLTSGQATFSGVTFSNADQNVLLQVSGAGIANTTAPSTFNVGGSTATNPRY